MDRLDKKNVFIILFSIILFTACSSNSRGKFSRELAATDLGEEKTVTLSGDKDFFNSVNFGLPYDDMVKLESFNKKLFLKIKATESVECRNNLGQPQKGTEFTLTFDRYGYSNPECKNLNPGLVTLTYQYGVNEMKSSERPSKWVYKYYEIIDDKTAEILTDLSYISKHDFSLNTMFKHEEILGIKSQKIEIDLSKEKSFEISISKDDYVRISNLQGEISVKGLFKKRVYSLLAQDNGKDSSKFDETKLPMYSFNCKLNDIPVGKSLASNPTGINFEYVSGKIQCAVNLPKKKLAKLFKKNSGYVSFDLIKINKKEVQATAKKLVEEKETGIDQIIQGKVKEWVQSASVSTEKYVNSTRENQEKYKSFPFPARRNVAIDEIYNQVLFSPQVDVEKTSRGEIAFRSYQVFYTTIVSNKGVGGKFSMPSKLVVRTNEIVDIKDKWKSEFPILKLTMSETIQLTKDLGVLIKNGIVIKENFKSLVDSYVTRQGTDRGENSLSVTRFSFGHCSKYYAKGNDYFQAYDHAYADYNIESNGNYGGGWGYFDVGKTNPPLQILVTPYKEAKKESKRDNDIFKDTADTLRFCSNESSAAEIIEFLK